jgi:cytochrome c oxidase subunit III
MPEAEPALQYADLDQQEHAARLGMWGFLSTEVLFFGALILMYVRYRMAYAEGFVEAARHTDLVLGTTNTAVLLTSSFLVAWAAAAVRLDSRRLVAILLTAAALLGLLFLGLKVVEYRREYHEHLVPGLDFAFPGRHASAVALFYGFYFVATGLHALHLVIGIFVLALIARKMLQGAYSARYHTPLTVAGLYWHFVDVVWIFLFPLIYLLERNA